MVKQAKNVDKIGWAIKQKSPYPVRAFLFFSVLKNPTLVINFFKKPDAIILLSDTTDLLSRKMSKKWSERCIG